MFGSSGAVSLIISLLLVSLVVVRFRPCLVSIFLRCLRVSVLHGKCCVPTVSLGCAAQTFPATSAPTRRWRCLRTLLFEAVLSGFVTLLRAFASLGFCHLHTGVDQGLQRPWLLVGGALRGMGTSWTLNGRVALTGPDPVPQLPVNLDGFRSFRLDTENKQLAFLKRKTREQQ